MFHSVITFTICICRYFELKMWRFHIIFTNSNFLLLKYIYLHPTYIRCICCLLAPFAIKARPKKTPLNTRSFIISTLTKAFETKMCPFDFFAP